MQDPLFDALGGPRAMQNLVEVEQQAAFCQVKMMEELK
jgi:hypothetical protein